VEGKSAEQRLGQREVVGDLRAALAARRELGGDLEEHLLESFLARVEQQIDARVDQRLKERTGSVSKRKAKDKYNPSEILGVTFGTAIPLSFVAGIFGHGIGIAAVMAAVIVVNLAYMIEHHLSRD
jgi:hypothetical protein